MVNMQDKYQYALDPENNDPENNDTEIVVSSPNGQIVVSSSNGRLSVSVRHDDLRIDLSCNLENAPHLINNFTSIFPLDLRIKIANAARRIVKNSKTERHEK